MKEYEITNFDFSPQLKELLKNYSNFNLKFLNTPKTKRPE